MIQTKSDTVNIYVVVVGVTKDIQRRLVKNYTHCQGEVFGVLGEMRHSQKSMIST